MRYFHRFVLAAMLSLLIHVSCTNNSSAGNTMETENSIALNIYTVSGEKAAHTKVRIRPNWYLPGSSSLAEEESKIRNITSDANGFLRIKDLPSGDYTIELYNDSQAVVLNYTHIFDSTATEQSLSASLQAAGALTGRIALPEGTDKAKVSFFGLDYTTETDDSGFFSFPFLPSGTLYISAANLEAREVLGEDLIRVSPMEELNLGTLYSPVPGTEDISSWKYSATIRTADLIPQWMAPLPDRVIVSLRLHSDNFNFSESLPNGYDFRLLSASGDLQPFHRDYWNASDQSAKIQILLDPSKDTVLTMYWGRGNALNVSSDTLWNGLSDSLFLAWNSILIDDFETPSNLNKLPDPPGPKTWYTVASEEATLISPAVGDLFSSGILEADSSRAGNAFRLEYEANAPQWALAGTILSAEPENFSGLDSIVFWARGSGNYSVSLENISEAGNDHKAWTHGTLTGNWQKISITPDQFLPPEEVTSNVGWEAVRDSITNLNFFGNDGSELWIDDIRLYGINRDDLH